MQARTAGAKHWRDVGDLVHGAGAVAEDQHCLGRGRYADALELLGVGGQLHQGGHPRAPGQLRVLHLVCSVGHATQEVGESDEGDRRLTERFGAGTLLGIPEGRLEYDVRAAAISTVHECLSRLLGHLGEAGLAHRGRARNLDDFRLLAIPLQHFIFVRVAEPRRSREHRVVVGRHFDVASELGVNAAQKSELALRGGREVARTRHDARRTVASVLHEHGVPFSAETGLRSRTTPTLQAAPDITAENGENPGVGGCR